MTSTDIWLFVLNSRYVSSNSTSFKISKYLNLSIQLSSNYWQLNLSSYANVFHVLIQRSEFHQCNLMLCAEWPGEMGNEMKASIMNWWCEIKGTSIYFRHSSDTHQMSQKVDLSFLINMCGSRLYVVVTSSANDQCSYLLFNKSYISSCIYLKMTFPSISFMVRLWIKNGSCVLAEITNPDDSLDPRPVH